MVKSSLLGVAGVLLLCSAAHAADYWVAPHVTSNGTVVQGHYQSSPNGTAVDNYSSRGNVNPYTGQAGTKNPYAPVAPAYVPATPQPYKFPAYPQK